MQCDGIRFVMLDECLVNHTPTPRLHPEQSSADLAVDAQLARTQLNSLPLHHRCLVAASTPYQQNEHQPMSNRPEVDASSAICDQMSNPVQLVDARSCTYKFLQSLLQEHILLAEPSSLLQSRCGMGYRTT